MIILVQYKIHSSSAPRHFSCTNNIWSCAKTMNFDRIVLPFDQEESNCLSTIVGANIHIVGERCWKRSFVWPVVSVRKPRRNWLDVVEVVLFQQAFQSTSGTSDSTDQGRRESVCHGFVHYPEAAFQSSRRNISDLRDSSAVFREWYLWAVPRVYGQGSIFNHWTESDYWTSEGRVYANCLKGWRIYILQSVLYDGQQWRWCNVCFGCSSPDVSYFSSAHFVYAETLYAALYA